MTWTPHIQTYATKARRSLMVTELEHAVRIRDGKIAGALAPGRHRMSRRRDRVATLPAVPTSLVVSGQEMLTADGVTVRATVAIVTRIVDPVPTLRAGDWHARLYMDIQLALRNAVTSTTLEDLLVNRADLDAPLRSAAGAIAGELGIEVVTLAVRDLIVPGEQRKLLAQIVEARLAGQASLERARGETAALRNLANAASLIRENPELFRLRLLQELGRSSGNTYVIDTEPPSA